MKEEIRLTDIEDRELRNLVRWERLMASYNAGGLVKSAEAQQSRVAAAEKRLVQIQVLEAVAARATYKELRNAQMAQIAADYRAAAAECQAVREAVDEVLALEEIVPAEDIDDILAEISDALGIELPDEATAKVDICHRGFNTIEGLKRELGPSLYDPVKQIQAAEADVAKAEELVSDLRRHALLQGLEASPVTEKYFEVGRDRMRAEKALLDFIKEMVCRAHDLTDAAAETPPKQSNQRAFFRPHGTEEWQPLPQNAKLTAASKDAY